MTLDPEEIKEIANEAASTVFGDSAVVVEEEGAQPAFEIEECHCDKLVPMAEWLAEEDKEGEQCHECILRPIGECYMGALEEEKAEDQIKVLETAWESENLLTIGKAMDTIKEQVGDDLKKKLMTFDCYAQKYKPVAAEKDQQQK